MSTHDQDEAHLRLVAGRALAAQNYPYFSVALYAMKPVRTNQLPTLAVDKWWRVYWNPSFVLSLTTAELSGVWIHELQHLLRDHNARFEDMLEPQRRQKAFNRAADAAINGDLRAERVPLPVDPSPVYPEHIPDGKLGMTAEQFFKLLCAQEEESGQCASCGEPLDSNEPSQSGESSPDSTSGSGDSGEPDGAESSSESTGGGSSDESEPGDSNGEGGGSEGTDPSEGQGSDGDGGGQGQGQSTNAGPSSTSGPHTCSPSQGQDCGSGAGGGPRSWDLPRSDDDGSVDPGRANLIRNQVAREIRDHIAGRGTVPGGWQRWADDVLQPQYDWRRDLESAIRHDAAAVAGKRDYTYQRPSRRTGGNPHLILPIMRQPRPPRCRIVVDTSGSVADKMLSQALAETSSILRRLSLGGNPSVGVIACDAAAAEMQSVKNAKSITLSGGGGTDMRVGIRVAATETPRADIIIVMTDGGTPWPKEVPVENPRAKYIAMILLPRGQGNREKLAAPEWMKTVYVEVDL